MRTAASSTQTPPARRPRGGRLPRDLIIIYLLKYILGLPLKRINSAVIMDNKIAMLRKKLIAMLRINPFLSRRPVNPVPRNYPAHPNLPVRDHPDNKIAMLIKPRLKQLRRVHNGNRISRLSSSLKPSVNLRDNMFMCNPVQRRQLLLPDLRIRLGKHNPRQPMPVKPPVLTKYHLAEPLHKLLKTPTPRRRNEPRNLIRIKHPYPITHQTKRQLALPRAGTAGQTYNPHFIVNHM